MLMRLIRKNGSVNWNFIKENFPKIIVIFGGPLATIRPALLLEEGRADIVVRYEGEYTMEELMDYYYHDKGSLEDIKGITYRDGNEIKHNPDRPFIEDLDTLPLPDRDLLYEPIKTFDIQFPRIITGRGCPFRCAFCHEGNISRPLRLRSVDRVLKDVETILDSDDNINYIAFLDDTFTISPDRVKDICKGLCRLRWVRQTFQ